MTREVTREATREATRGESQETLLTRDTRQIIEICLATFLRNPGQPRSLVNRGSNVRSSIKTNILESLAFALSRRR